MVLENLTVEKKNLAKTKKKIREIAYVVKFC